MIPTIAGVTIVFEGDWICLSIMLLLQMVSLLASVARAPAWFVRLLRTDNLQKASTLAVPTSCYMRVLARETRYKKYPGLQNFLRKFYKWK
jgi:hypothetical protein